MLIGDIKLFAYLIPLDKVITLLAYIDGCRKVVHQGGVTQFGSCETVMQDTGSTLFVGQHV
jgi:hypothetical protein